LDLHGYVLRGGFLDGIEGLVFHTLQRFWFRFLIDARIWEMQRAHSRRLESRRPQRRLQASALRDCDP